MEKLKSFEELRHGDKIISPIDNVVTEFYIDKHGDKYLAGKKCIFPLHQFDVEDYYLYEGDKEVGEVDNEYFNNL